MTEHHSPVATASLSRRTVVAGSSAVGIAAALGGLGTSPGAAVAQTEPAGGITVALNGDPTLNPITWPTQLPSILVGKNVFSTLVKFSSEDGVTVVPDLATDWDVSEDGLSWTFALRDDVTWHDGTPLTADDVKFTIDSIIDPDIRAQFRAALSGVTGAEVVDPHTVTITSSEPLASLPTILAYNIAIAPKHLLEEQDINEATEFVQSPVGTGPYKVREIVAGDRVVLDANTEYFDGSPAIATLTYRVVPDVNQVVAQLQTGELDMATIEAANLHALEGVDTIQFSKALETNTFAIYLNNSRWPFDDVNVRKAMTMAMDRDIIVEQLLLGEATVGTSTHSPAFGLFYNNGISPYPYDVDQASALMEDAGFTKEDGVWTKEGERFAIELIVDKGNPVREQLALVVQQFWQDFGVDVTLSIVEWSVYIERGGQVPGDYDARTGWRFTSPDPDKTSEYATGAPQNHYAYSNPVADDLLARGRAELDSETREAIYHELQRVIYDDAPIVWVYYPNGIFAYNKRIQDVPEINVRDALSYVYKMTLA